MAVVAHLLGTPLQPWQRHVADVAGELVPDPDNPDRLVHAYNVVTVSVGRRAGKSLLTIARVLATLTGSDGRAFAYYTAQNGKAAAERFRNDWVPMAQAAPRALSGRIVPRLTNGTETWTDTPSRSYCRIFAPIPKALHGDAGDLILFDEAWAHDLARGEDLEVAAFPLTATRPGAQVWILSAAGDVDSTWWAKWLDQGRAAAAVDTGRGHAHLEWSADAPGLDLADPAVWVDSHPGVRHPGNPSGVIPLDFLTAEHDRDPGQFARTYLNVTDRTGTTSNPIDPDTWADLIVEPPERGDTPVTIGVAVSAGQESAAIVAAHHVAGVVVLELIDHRPGHTWVPERVVELFDRWNTIERVALDAGGASPAAGLRRPLEAAGLPVAALGLADVTGGAADLVAAVRGGTIRHVPHPALDAAVAGARRRPIGDGAWAWGRIGDTDTAALEAATHARWVHPAVAGHAPPSIR